MSSSLLNDSDIVPVTQTSVSSLGTLRHTRPTKLAELRSFLGLTGPAGPQGPAGPVNDLPQSTLSPGISETVAAAYSAVVIRKYKIASGQKLTIGSGAILRIL